MSKSSYPLELEVCATVALTGGGGGRGGGAAWGTGGAFVITMAGAEGVMGMIATATGTGKGTTIGEGMRFRSTGVRLVDPREGKASEDEVKVSETFPLLLPLPLRILAAIDCAWVCPLTLPLLLPLLP